MTRKSRRAVLGSLGAAAAVGLAGCAGGSDDTPTEGDDGGGTAQVRAAHMSPDAPNVDILVDGDAVLEDVPFRAVSEYLELGAGSYQVSITAAGDPDTVVFDQELELEANDYTLVAAGELAEDGADFQVLPLVDDNGDPGGDSAKLRAVHLSPDASAVDVTVAAGPTLFDGVAFTDAAYATVEANDYTAQVRPDTDGNDGQVVYEEDVSLNGGTVYTAFAAGYLSPDDEPTDQSFRLEVTQDASY